MNPPSLGDVILVQVQHFAPPYPYAGSFHTFWFNSKIVPPVHDPSAGIGYFYLSMGETATLSRGTGLFPPKYTVIYLGNGRVSVSRANCDNPNADDIETFSISNNE